MADISKITLPNNSSYDIKDAIARNKLNVLTHNMATCATGRATAAKVATLANFSLNVGATIAVKFTDTAGTANPTSGNLTLNVNGTGAKNIGYFRNGNKAALRYSNGGYFFNNQTHIFTYDGTYWLYMDWNADNNTDTKVTSVGNHYTPAKSTTKSASGGTLTDIANSSIGTQVVTGVEMDAKGHVTGVTSIALKSTDTKVTVDSVLSSTSTNPVQNKVVKQAIDNKADKTVATTSTDGLMSAEDKVKLDAFEITATGGKLHDKDIATTDLIPTTLPANGGDADTVGGKSADDFIRRYGSAKLSAEYVSEAAMDTDYKGVIDDDVANNIGLDGSNSCWWHIIGLKNFNDDGYGTQIAIPLYPTTSLQKPKYRTSAGTVFQSWQNFADGGNADTVGGKSPSDFLPFQAYAPIYTGDIKDISNMGTYSCYKGNCTNLPDIKIWAYVIMIRFRDAGHKTFLCIEFTPSPATQHCRNIYIAREYDVDSSGNMIWYRACDGGIAETISDWGVQTVSDANNAPYGFSNTSPNSANAPDTFWATILTVGATANGYKQQFAFPWGMGRATKYRVQDGGNWGSWVNIADGGNAATVNGRPAYRIPTLDSNGNLWDASAPNANDLYAQWDASKRYFKLKTFGGNNVAVDIATSNTASLQCTADGTITGLSNGAAKTVSLPFSPVFVLFHSNGHVVQGGFALSCGTNSFTITPANVSTMGSTAVGYIAFGR